MIFNIALRELKSLFLSPLAWAILAVVQIICAYFFLLGLDSFFQNRGYLNYAGAPGVTDFTVMPVSAMFSACLLIVIPLLTMRLISEERRNKTLVLLLTSPISTSAIIIGKYLSVILFFGMAILLIALMSLSLSGGTHLDYGKIAAICIGLLLLMAAFSAIGLYISCLTRHPGVAAVVTFGISLMLGIIHLAIQTNATVTGEILAWISPLKHQFSFQSGLLNSGDIAYYLIVSGLFLLLSIRRLDAERLHG